MYERWDSYETRRRDRTRRGRWQTKSRARREVYIDPTKARLVELSLLATAGIFLTLITTFLGVGIAFIRQLPPVNLERIVDNDLVTNVYDAKGEPIGEFYERRHTKVPISRMPTHLIEAVLAVEDVDFYRHSGVSPGAILRALLVNLKEGRTVQGGSTITQQLARMNFLTSKRTASRKIKEILLAVQIERRFTKDEILESYLNKVYFGSGAWGVQSAALTYYGKDVEDLTLAQCATIIGTIRWPEYYSPLNNPKVAEERREVVLQRMASAGFIDGDQIREAMREPILGKGIRPGDTGRVIHSNQAPYFMEYVRQWLEDRYGTDAIYRGGLKVYTTLDLEWQRAAQKALREGLERTDKLMGFRRPKKATSPPERVIASEREKVLNSLNEGDREEGVVESVSRGKVIVNIRGIETFLDLSSLEWTGSVNPTRILERGDAVWVKVSRIDRKNDMVVVELDQKPKVQGAIVAVDPKTGYIKAMVGGYDFYDDENNGKFNRAFQARRQPGSAFKPFIYAAALDSGYTAASAIVDEPVSYKIRGENAKGVWRPQNYTHRHYGLTTLRTALEQSRNVVSVRLLDELVAKIGYDGVIKYPQRMMNIGESRFRQNLTLALGTVEVTPLELASGYAVFASGGVRNEPIAITEVRDRDGNIIYSARQESERILSPQTAYIMNQILRGVVQRGTAVKAKHLGDNIAGKTGTTDEAIDLWFAGYTPHVSAVVYMGYDDRAPMVTKFGRSVYSLETALPTWIDFMEAISKDLPQEDFARPDGIVTAKIDSRTGKLAVVDNPYTIEEVFKSGTAPRQYSPISDIPAESGPDISSAGRINE
ncbi:MAG: penicillin-binding protein 1A [bacterium]